MANFLKCTQEFVTYKLMKKEITGHELKTVFLFFIKKIPIYTETLLKEVRRLNNPINLDKARTIAKTTGAFDYDSDNNPIEGTGKPGLYLSIDGDLHYWYYNDEKTRDVQFEEVASNSQLYKSKVSI